MGKSARNAHLAVQDMLERPEFRRGIFRSPLERQILRQTLITIYLQGDLDCTARQLDRLKEKLNASTKEGETKWPPNDLHGSGGSPAG